MKLYLHLDIKVASAFSKTSPRTAGAYIESKPAIRFLNTVNSFIRSKLFYSPVGDLSSLKFSSLISWLARQYRPILSYPTLSSSIVVNRNLFGYRVERSWMC
jgi:hypothetical protein